MHMRATQLRSLLAFVLALAVVLPAAATTLVRQSLEDLAASNGTIFVGEVTDVQSYWNADGTFILSDVYFAPSEAMKGRPGRELKVTILGGTVGELTTLIVGGPEFVPGRAYVVFVGKADLPGVHGALTVPDLCQGVFDLVAAGGELRAVSQANRHPLVPDALGYVDAPGGVEGLPLAAMVQSLRETVNRVQIRREVP